MMTLSRHRDSITLTQPMINPEIWDEIPHSHVRPPVSLTQVIERGASNSKSKITEEDQFAILLLVKWTF